MKKVKMIFLSSVFMYNNNLNTNSNNQIKKNNSETTSTKKFSSASKRIHNRRLNTLIQRRKPNKKAIISSANNPYEFSESASNDGSYKSVEFQPIAKTSHVNDPYGSSESDDESIKYRTESDISDSIKTSENKTSHNKSIGTLHTTNALTPSNKSVNTIPSSMKPVNHFSSSNNDFVKKSSSIAAKSDSSKTFLDLNQISSQDFSKYLKSQMNTNKINILENLNESYASNSNIYENFIINIQKTKLYSLAKTLNINIEDLIKNIPNASVQIDLTTEFNTYEEILDSVFELTEQKLSDITNFTNIKIQLDQSIKSLQDSINTTDKKNITTINLINSVIDLLQKFKKNIAYFSNSIKTDLDKIRVCYKIDFFSTLLSSTQDELKEEIIENRIKEIWEFYRLKYFENNQNHIDLLSKKYNKDTSIEDFNNFPINFQEDLNAIINYAKSTTEKMNAIILLIQPLSNLANLANSFLENKTSLDSLTKLEDNFQNMNNIVQKIKINNTLPNVTSSINHLYTTLNDSLTLILIEAVQNAENINNKNNAGFFKTFKRTFAPITLSGLASLRNVLMFNHFKIHSNDLVDKYSLSAHDWYSSNYRIPNILNTISTDNKKSIVKALELQKSIILKLIETFNHNYQSKNLLTKKDYKHIKKLISQLQIIMNILTSLKASSETASSSLKTLEDLKFNLHSVSEDLNYIKRNSYQPNESFFISKKIKEFDSIQILTSETNNEQLRYLTKILYEFFNNGKKSTKISEEDSKDLKDNNLFDLKTNHTEFLNKK